MKRFSLLAAIMAFLTLPVMAETEVEEEILPRKVNLGVSFGMEFPKEAKVDLPKVMIRDGRDAAADCFNWHLEFSSEFFFCNERFSIGTGLRFANQIATSDRYWDDMYWLVNENETTRDYITITALGQRNFYLGVPLSMRVFFAPLSCRVRPYLKVNANFDFKVATNNYAGVWNNRMETIYGNSVKDELGKPKVFHPSIYASGGIRIRCHNFYVNPEVIMPSIQLGESPISFIEMSELRCGAGLKLTFQFPVGGEKVTEVKSTYDSNIQSEKAMPSEDF